jgi:uncharacterized membrane protein YfcA
VTLDPLTVGALVALVLLAAFINGTLGFGYALLAVNALALVFGAREGVIIMSVMAPVLSGLQAWHHRDRRPVLTRLRTLLPLALLGTLIGTQLLVFLPGPAIALALGLFTVWYVVDSIRAERAPLTGATQRWLAPIAGLVGGTSNGAIGASGPVFGTYLTAIGLRGPDFAFAISIVFFVMAILRIGLLAVLDQYTFILVATGIGLALPSIAVQRLGLWFKGRLPEQALYRGVLVILFLAGANLLWRAVTTLAAPATG